MFSREKWRFAVLFFAIQILLLGVSIRLFQVQVLSHDKYKSLAENQHGISYNLPAARGKIYSHDKFPLVTNQPSYLFYAEPEKLPLNQASKVTIAKRILKVTFKGEKCPVINFSSSDNLDEYQYQKTCQEALVKRMSFDRQWVPLIRNVLPGEKKLLEQYNFSGLGFEITPARYYPEDCLAAHILGFVGSDKEGKEQGYFGLEGYYDGDLGGRAGLVLEERSALGEPILVGDYMKRPPEPGRDLVLTLDRAVQFLVEEKLQQGVEHYDAEGGTVIVLEPTTGRILSMANWPLFPEDVGKTYFEKDDDGEGNQEQEDDSKDSEEEREKKESDSAQRSQDKINCSENRKSLNINSAIAAGYEPGSVIKALTMAAAINENQVKPQTTFISRPLQVGGHTITTWDNKYYGEETMTEVLERSDNTGAAWVALEKLGKRTLSEYFFKFGLGRKTGIDLEGEAAGIIKPLAQWRDIDLANASFGQGISATPLQVANAFAVFANEGVLMKPYIVSRIRDGDRTISFYPQKERRVVSKHSAEVMEGMLTKAAMHGEAQYFVLNDWQVAGKTGTAQIPVEGRYDPNKTNTTFVGFLPNSKKFVMLVKLEKPTKSIYAAETAVPLWMEIAKELIRCYGIPADR